MAPFWGGEGGFGFFFCYVLGDVIIGCFFSLGSNLIGATVDAFLESTSTSSKWPGPPGTNMYCVAANISFPIIACYVFRNSLLRYNVIDSVAAFPVDAQLAMKWERCQPVHYGKRNPHGVQGRIKSGFPVLSPRIGPSCVGKG
ncbi:hypothetical protein F5Y07DRAFT_9033 [Xylaria sp. FL0933]|nr:hypothetical protein F5Y07DRAFT_9033 [Xylaria sp. FL0933]